jgi:hypothetical protein
MLLPQAYLTVLAIAKQLLVTIFLFKASLLVKHHVIYLHLPFEEVSDEHFHLCQQLGCCLTPYCALD